MSMSGKSLHFPTSNSPLQRHMQECVELSAVHRCSDSLVVFLFFFFPFLSCPELQTCFICPWGQTDAARALTNSPANKLPAKKQ